MHRWWGLAMLLVGCGRLHFDDRATGPDAPSAVALACNVPARVTSTNAAMPRLSAAATQSYLGAAWIEDDGSVRLEGVHLADADHGTSFARTPAPGPVDVVALAATKTTALLALAAGLTTEARLIDDATGATVANPILPVAITGPRGAAAISADTFVLSGNAARAAAYPVAQTGAVGTPLDLGNTDPALVVVPLETRVGLVDTTSTPTCEIKSADLALATRTQPVTWGPSGNCTQASAVHAPGRADMLLMRHDGVDNDTNHALATLSGSTIAPSPEMRLRTPSNEPRGAGVASTYWVIYETAGMLEVVAVDFAGVVATPLVLGPAATATGHDITVRDGEAYAMYISDGSLWAVHVCL